jgi:D-glycero-alpha-D-manno-heptose-7-phosphate kinase
MILTKTPYRISLFGGGSDYPKWYRENGGEVISFAIDKFCYVTARILPPFFKHRYHVSYSKIEKTKTISEIRHPAVRAALQKYCAEDSVEINHVGDLPARSGIGSSSAFAVGLIHSLFLLKGLKFSKESLAKAAIELEQHDLGENVGSQDQIACSVGGFNYIKFGGEQEWEIEKMNVSNERVEEIEQRVVLIYTGLQRISSDIQSTLFLEIDGKARLMNRTIELARESRAIFSSTSDLDIIGELLKESWMLKKQMNSRSVTRELEEFWIRSQKAGALGGKVLGAGGGGFCMFWVGREGKEKFLKEFGAGTHVPIRISSDGTTTLTP